MVMLVKESSLYRLCLVKTAWLLKNSLWNESDMEDNPFSALPSSVVDDLIDCVLHLTASGSLKVTDLYHLLSSGRVEHFKLGEIAMKSDEFEAILMALSSACSLLKSVTLTHIFFEDSFSWYSQTKGSGRKIALECLFSCAHNLEQVQSCIQFDLKALRLCTRLKVLRINFVLECHLYDFLQVEEEGDSTYLKPHNSLQLLEVFEDSRHQLHFKDIAPILRYCPFLLQTSLDVSRALEYLHRDELYMGTLTASYKLQKCLLGNGLQTDGSASLWSVHLATLACPHLRDVEMLASDHETVSALGDLESLSSLLLQWDSPEGGDFQQGTQRLLEKAGPKLLSLTLYNFRSVDFSAIATHCPQLEELRIEFLSELRRSKDDLPQHPFKSLQSLHLEPLDNPSNISKETLFLLLKNSSSLQRLNLQAADDFTDGLLRRVLAAGGLTNVTEATLTDCSLTEEGVRLIALNLPLLEYLELNSSFVAFEAAAAIVHSINQHVIMRCG